MKTEIEKYNPCDDALEFRKQYASFKEAWNACERGDWMLWIASKVGVDLQTITLCKGHVANTVRSLMKDPRSIAAVDAAIAFGEGKITREELDKARAAAADAYAAAAADAAAAYAATDAYDAAAAYAATAAYAAAYAATAAADADAAAAAYDGRRAAREANQKATADICRKYLTTETLKLII